MSPRNWKYRLEDIDEAIDLIFRYTEDLNYNSWKKDRKTIDAVIRNLEIIGEAATHIPSEITEKHADIPWAQMKGIRNVLVHEYFGVDAEVLWRTITEDLPSLKNQIQQLLLKVQAQ
ncbi:MAG: DUF86 domain-containing protein [Proteobacteria bacterium]|nr:DUF86 domain-containing protein [Pseudomonadota bacterium]